MSASNRQPPVRESEPRAGDFGSVNTPKLSPSQHSRKRDAAVVTAPFGLLKSTIRGPLSPSEVRAFTRWNELRRLAKHRGSSSQLANQLGWVTVISNLLGCTTGRTGRAPTAHQVRVIAGKWGMPEFETAAFECLNESTLLLSARNAALALSLRKIERAALKIRTIDAEDELAKTRKKRLCAEASKRRRIKKGAKPHKQSAAQLQPWKVLGISKSTYYAKGLNRSTVGS